MCEIDWGLYKGVPDASQTKSESGCVEGVFEARIEPSEGGEVAYS